MTVTVQLREVAETDLPLFFEQQFDPAANRIADVVTRDKSEFFAHWTTKVLPDQTGVKKAIVFDGQVAGNILSWKSEDKWLVGYRLGRQYWGKGIATAALMEFLRHFQTRPLYAYVARQNVASTRVLEKCGFTLVSRCKAVSQVDGREIDDTLWVCA